MSEFDIAASQRETRFESVGFELTSTFYALIDTPAEFRDQAMTHAMYAFLAKEFDSTAEASEFIEWFRAYLRDAFEPMNDTTP